MFVLVPSTHWAISGCLAPLQTNWDCMVNAQKRRNVGALLFTLAALRLQVEVPEELQTQLRAAMEAAGIPVPKSDERWAKAMTALKVCVTPRALASVPMIAKVAECFVCKS